MHKEAHYHDRIPAEFRRSITKQAEQYTAENLTNANANARQADQLLCNLAKFQCESDAGTVDTAEE